MEPRPDFFSNWSMATRNSFHFWLTVIESLYFRQAPIKSGQEMRIKIMIILSQSMVKYKGLTGRSSVGRAHGWGSCGRTFKSCRPDKEKRIKKLIILLSSILLAYS